MNNSFEEQDSLRYLAEINNEYAYEYDENSEGQFSLPLDSLNISERLNFFWNNDIFNYNVYRPNTHEISTNENSNLKNKISNKVLSGRKRKRKITAERKIHDKYDEDNILRKINVHFLNFLISFLNEILSKCNIKEEKFKKINGKYKKIINQKNFNFIKNETIEKILNKENDEKFNDKYINKELFNSIKDKKIFNKIISKKYIEIFKEFYYTNEKKNKIIYEGLELNLTNTYGDFMNKIKGDNLYKQNIEKVIQKNYFPKKFKIDKCK